MDARPLRSALGAPAALVLALVAAALAWVPRRADDTQRVELAAEPGRATWVSQDADSAYHMRRVRRALTEGLPVAERDPLLAWPDGAAIPWPPYYTWVLLGLIAPDAPRPDDDAALRAHVETRTASLPLVFGCLTAVVVALAASRLGALAGSRSAAWTAGLVAAVYYAFTQAAVNYARLGNGDHHAFVSLLHAAALALLAAALAGGTLASRRRARLLGGAAGALLGLALGTWVAALVYVLEVELLLAVLLFVHARRALPGLAPLGLAFHLAALLVVAHAVLSSPWKDANPWFVINLSWYHLLHLALGALVFVPLLARPRDERLRRTHPWLVGATLVALAGLLWILDTPIARGVADGFEWAAARDAFMAEVQESQPLLGAGALARALGAGVFLLPLAWLAAVFAARRPERAPLLPWAIAAPVAALEAAGQYRFADALAVPLAVLLGWGCAALAVRLGRALGRPDPSNGGSSGVPWLATAVGVALALVAHWSTLDATAVALSGRPRPALEAVHERHRGIREVCAWLAATDEPADAPRGVLASWGFGHVIEWAASRPTVATNFGAYVGEAGFRAPARFFLARDPHRALEVLEDRDARWVVVTAQLARELPSLIREADPSLAPALVGTDDLTSWDGNVTAAWLQTMGARLSFACAGAPTVTDVPPPPRFLRLVHRTPERDPQPGLAQLGRDVPVACVWERVPGALLEARGAPGDELAVTLDVRYPDGFRLRFAASAGAAPDPELGAAPVARLRVPYSTSAPNGDGEVISARWSFAGRKGELRLDEADVREGRSVPVP